MSLKAKLTHTNASLWAPLVLRIVVGAIFVAHGGQKLFGWWGGYGFQATAGFFNDKLGLHPGAFWAGLAGGGELFGGALLILGLMTRLAALNTTVIMAVAIWTAHMGKFFLPDGMEYALTLLAASLVLLETGGGALSIDSKIANGAATKK